MFELTKQGFKQSKNDYLLFVKTNGDLLTIVAVYADDIILTGSDTHIVHHIKSHLDKVFSIKDLGELSFFIDIEVSYLPEGIALTQAKFTKELLNSCALYLSKPTVTPLPINLKLIVDYGVLLEGITIYKCLVGKLNFLTQTRADLGYNV